MVVVTTVLALWLAGSIGVSLALGQLMRRRPSGWMADDSVPPLADAEIYWTSPAHLRTPSLTAAQG